MSINYQINNIIHAVRSKKNINISYIPANSLYDQLIDNINGITLINYKTIIEKNISYGLMMVNDVYQILNNDNKILKNSYANKIIFFHDNVFLGMKKEDQYLLYNTIKEYSLYSYIENLPIPNVNYIRYGIEESVKLEPIENRTNDILLLSNINSYKQSNIIFKSLQGKFENIKHLPLTNNTHKDLIIKEMNSSKICIDLTSYYNLLFAISNGCYGITNKESFDTDFIYSVKNLDEIVDIIPKMLDKYDNDYILSTKNYMSSKYNNENFIETFISLINKSTNLPVSL